MKNQTVTVWIVALFLLMVPGHLSAQDATPTPAVAEWLFTVNFREAQLEPDADVSGQATLTLINVDSEVLAFSDRPERESALISTSDFTQLIGQAPSVPVNANLVARLPESTDAAELVVELLSAEHNDSSNTLVLQLEITGGEIGGEAVASDMIQPLELRSGYLFVDPECAVPVDQGLETCFGDTGGTPTSS